MTNIKCQILWEPLLIVTRSYKNNTIQLFKEKKYIYKEIEYKSNELKKESTFF
jgi:hypothetical protein